MVRKLEEFRRHRESLETILGELSEAFETLGIPTRSQDFETARRKLLNEQFSLAVVGEMKHGKSTFINAILGDLVLPSWGGVVCTAVPIRVRFGETKHAICYRRSPLEPEHLDLDTDPQALRERVTVRPREGSRWPETDGDAIGMHPFTKADVFWPTEFGRNGAEIHDTPGMNEGGPEGLAREAAVWELLAAEADAVVLVFSCTQFGKASEEKTLRHVLETVVDPSGLFVVLNRFDDCETEGDQERVRQKVRETLLPEGITEERIFYVSSRKALEGRRSRNDSLVSESLFLEMEGRINDFLLREKSSTKLLGSINVAERGIVEALTDAILRVEGRPAANLKTAAETRKEVDQVRRRAADSSRSLAKRLRQISQSVAKASETAVAELAKTLCNGVRSALDSVPLSTREALAPSEAVKERLADRAKAWAEIEVAVWEQKFIDGVIHEHVTEFRGDVEDAVEQLVAARDEILAIRHRVDRDLGGVSLRPAGAAEHSASEGADDVRKSVRRILTQELASVATLSDLMPGAVMGGIAAAWLGMVLLAAFALPLVVIGVIVGGLLGARRAANRLRDKVAAELRKAIGEKTEDLQRDVANSSRSKFLAVSESVRQELDTLRQEIDGIAKEIEGICVELENEAVAASERYANLRSRLQGHAEELASIRQAIDPLSNPGRLADLIAARMQDLANRGPPTNGPEMEPKIPTASRGSVGGVDIGLPLRDLLGLLERGCSERLDAVVERLTKAGRGRGDLKARIAEMWSWFPDIRAHGVSGSKSVIAYRAVTSLAVAEGATLPPELGEVREWLQNQVRRFELEGIADAFAWEGAVRFIGDEGQCREDEEDAGDEGGPVSLETFLQRYNRGRRKAIPAAPQMRRGTVIGEKDRDPDLAPS